MVGTTEQHHQGQIPAPGPEPLGLLALLRTLFRWSWVVAPMVAVTVWLALSQTEAIQPEYTASSALLLVGPTEVLVEDFDTGEVRIEDINPLQQLGGNLSTVARVLVLAMSDARVGQQLVSEGLSDSTVVWSETRSPIIRIEAVHENPDIAVATTDRMAELVVDELDNRQETLDAPESNRLQIQSVTTASAGGPDYGSRDRVRIAIAAVGLAISAATAFFLEGIYQLWRRRNERKAVAEAAAAERALPSGAAISDRVSSPTEAGSSADLVEREHATLVGVLRLLSGNEGAAETIAGEVAAKTHAEWSDISKGDPVSWYYGFAINKARQANIAPNTPKDSGALWDAVMGLPMDTRAILALGSVAELSSESIAAVMHLSVPTVVEHQAVVSGVLASVPDDSEHERRLLGRNRAAQPAPASNTGTAKSLRKERPAAKADSVTKRTSKQTPRAKNPATDTTAELKKSATKKTAKAKNVAAQTTTELKNTAASKAPGNATAKPKPKKPSADNGAAVDTSKAEKTRADARQGQGAERAPAETTGSRRRTKS